MSSFKLARRDTPDRPSPDADIPEQFRIRQAKRERLLAEGREPYPVEVARTHTLAEVRQAYPDLAANTETGQQRRCRRPGDVRPQLRQAVLRDTAGG